MNFEDIHGSDIRFTSPNGKDTITFMRSGYGLDRERRELERKSADAFRERHPDWVETVEKF